jgi:hypothetical protein
MASSENPTRAEIYWGCEYQEWLRILECTEMSEEDKNKLAREQATAALRNAWRNGYPEGF